MTETYAGPVGALLNHNRIKVKTKYGTDRPTNRYQTVAWRCFTISAMNAVSVSVGNGT